MKTFFALLLAFVATTADARPGRWCGWYARFNLVASDPGPEYNQACKWNDYGSPASMMTGAMVVWCSKHHKHVGKITGDCEGTLCVVTSGNDGGGVRTRRRDVAGANFRM